MIYYWIIPRRPPGSVEKTLKPFKFLWWGQVKLDPPTSLDNWARHSSSAYLCSDSGGNTLFSLILLIIPESDPGTTPLQFSRESHLITNFGAR